MREKYSTLSMAQLRELAKVRGIKGIFSMHKEELVDALVAEEEEFRKQEKPEPSKPAEEKPVRESAPAEPKPEAEKTQERPADRLAVPRPVRNNEIYDEKTFPKELDSGEEACGIFEQVEGYGFIRCANFMPGDNDVYVAPSQVRKFGLKTGDILRGNKRVKTQQEKFAALLYIKTINGYSTEEAVKRGSFDEMTPIFPDERIKLECPGCSIAMRVTDLISPVGK